MRFIHVLVEGQTEEIVVREIFEPSLAPGASLNPVLLKTKRPAGGPSHRGGVSSWKKIERDIRLLLGDTSAAYVTTVIDYYGLPDDCPGMTSRPAGSAYDRVAYVEEQIARQIDHPRFIPHLAMHETEAWVFAAATQLGALYDNMNLAHLLGRQLAEAGGAELINDDPTTAPSKRLLSAYPAYNKTFDGPAAISDLGLPALRDACPHLDAWLRRLTA